MNIENKENVVKTKPLFEQNCLKIENFQQTIVASLGFVNEVRCSFQMKFLTVLIFLLTFCIKTKSNVNIVAEEQINIVILNPVLMENSIDLQNFYDTSLYSNKDKIVETELKIQEVDLTTAYNEIQAVNSESFLDEQNKQLCQT